MSENYIDHWSANGQMYDIQDAGRGLPNGVATLDLNGRVPYSQLPESAVEFKGYWNASTNTPTLADGTGTKGDMYYVDVAGIRDLGSGTQRFYVGDRVLYDGSVWKNMNPDLIDLFLPVGHIIWTSNENFNPNNQYPGTTWTQIKDKFILAAGDTYSNGSTGGAATVTLTVDEMPSHSHSGKTGDDSPDHVHDMSHGHTASTSVSGSILTGKDAGTNSNYPGRCYGDQDLRWLAALSLSASTSVDSHNGHTGGASARHQHSISAEGGGQAHENMPPYVAKFCWERTA